MFFFAEMLDDRNWFEEKLCTKKAHFAFSTIKFMVDPIIWPLKWEKIARDVASRKWNCLNLLMISLGDKIFSFFPCMNLWTQTNNFSSKSFHRTQEQKENFELFFRICIASIKFIFLFSPVQVSGRRLENVII